MAKLLALIPLFTILSFANGLVIPKDYNASVESFPYIVSLQKSENHFCCGIVLSYRYILTTASCFELVELYDLKFMKVVAGSAHPNQGGVSTKVSGFFMHPKYVNLDVTYDVAVVELEEDLKFSNKISAASLVDETFDVPAGTTVNITGFGINQGDFAPRVLKYAEVKVIGNDECQQFWPKKLKNNQLICAGDSNEDVGYGDAGAPMTLDGRVVGYASLLSMRDGNPSLFTKISSIRSWIKEYTGA